MTLFDTQPLERQAEETANEHYARLESEVIGAVRSKLAARKMHLDESDLEEAYCQAWHGVCEAIKRGTVISNLPGMLIEITWRRAVDVYREIRPGQRAEIEIDQHGVSFDLDEQLDDQIKLKRFMARLRDRLNRREREAVSLCLIHGYTRPEAAERLGLGRAQMEKLMDGATKKIGGIVASIDARGCGGDEWTRLMKAYALGLIAEDDRDYPRAAAHAEGCEACRRYINGLRGLAGILPPFALPLPVASAGHGVGIFAYLRDLLRGHGGGGAAEAARAAGGAGAAGGASGGTLASSLSTGAVAKGVAVLAGAAAIGLAARGERPHHHRVARNAPASAARNPSRARSSAYVPPLAGPSPSATRSPQVARRQAYSAGRAGQSSAQTAVSREFGIENARTASAAPAAPRAREFAPRATQAHAETASAGSGTGNTSAQSASVGREFSFER